MAVRVPVAPRVPGLPASVSWPLVVGCFHPGRGSAILSHLRFHRDIGNAADKSQEKYPEDRAASPTGFLLRVHRASCFRGVRLIEFLFREFQIRFWLAGEMKSQIKRTPRPMSGSQRAQPSSTSLLSNQFPRGLICGNTYHHRRVVSILLRNCLRVSTCLQQGCVGLQEKTCLFSAARF